MRSQPQHTWQGDSLAASANYSAAANGRRARPADASWQPAATGSHGSTTQAAAASGSDARGWEAADDGSSARVGSWQLAQLCAVYGAIAAHIFIMAYTDPLPDPTFVMLLLLFT